jgi:uncharacterized protein YkwD
MDGMNSAEGRRVAGRVLHWPAITCVVCVPALFAIAGPLSTPDARQRRVAPPAARHPSALEQAVLDEINWARTHPGQAADYLDKTIAPLFLLENKEAFKDEPTTRAPLPEERGLYRTTQEGLGLVRETAAWLRAQRPRPAVEWNDALGRMADALVTLQGPSGEMGHDRHGVDWMSLASGLDPRLVCCGETNSYGSADPRTIVIDLIVDDGVPSRGHRATIFDASKGYNVVGIAVGPHTTHRFMCVIDWGVLRPKD